MSTTAPTPTNGHHRTANGVRTYRGRKLEDLIPKIRAELGPDAIILREREGLMGGINGFFAQRFIEVEARPAAPRVDVYDDDDLPDEQIAAAVVRAPEPIAQPASDSPLPGAVLASDTVSDTAVEPEASGPASPAESFARQLEEAAAAALADFAFDEPEPVAVLVEPEPEPEPGPELVLPDPVAEIVEDPHNQAAKPKTARKPRNTAAKARTAAAKPRKSSRPRKTIAAPIAEGLPVAVEAPVQPPTFERPSDPAPPAAKRSRTRRTGSGRLARALGGVQAAAGKSAAPARAAEAAGGAAAVAAELVQCGISDAWARQLIGEAGAHAAPFAHQSGLRGAVRSALASSVAHARPLPAAGAAVAFVGAGGAGKTRCAATFAAAYGRASTLSVSPISLASADGGRELSDLLRAEDIAVTTAKDGVTLARRVEKAREGAVVVIDTPAVAPADGLAVARLAADLEPLSLDAIYVVLPATLGAQTGKRLLTGLAPLRPTGLSISHADETDQIGIAVELAWASRLPVCFIHEGLDIHKAMSTADPYQLASRLLP